MNGENHAPSHDELRELCAAHALGALDPPDSARMEAHLREGCETCLDEIAAHRGAVAALASLSGTRTPPPGAEKRLMERVALAERTGRAAAPGRRAVPSGSRLRWLPAAAAVLLAIPALWFAIDVYVQKKIGRFESTTDPIVSIYELQAHPLARGARARATFDPRNSMVRVFMHDLAPPPEGGSYHGWLFTASGARNLGRFAPDRTGHAILEVRLEESAEGIRFLVTFDPPGGGGGPDGEALFDYPGTAR